MINYGKANVVVDIYNTLPNVKKDVKKWNFDVSAWNWESIVTSKFFQPLLTENITDEQIPFSVCHPSKRKYFINNYIVGANDTPSNPTGPAILWKPIEVPLTGPFIPPYSSPLWNTGVPFVAQYLTALSMSPATQSGITPTVLGLVKDWPDPNPPNGTMPSPGNYSDPNYKGQKWANDPKPNKDPAPNDIRTLGDWVSWIGSLWANNASSIPDLVLPPITSSSDSNLIPNIGYIKQSETRDGLYWAIESSDFLNENSPFWINIDRTLPPPTKEPHETFIVVSLGLNDQANRFDLYLSNQKKPQIFDYETGNVTPTSHMQYDIEPSKLLTDEQHIEIGFMTAGGKLIVFVNKNLMIYTRIQHSPSVPDDLGIIKECKIGAGKIRIYGSNVQASINVCPMTFAPLSVMAFEIPVMETTGPDGIETTAGLIYHGINNKGVYDGTVARIPQEPDVPGVLYGVDCEFFRDATSRYDAPYGFGFHEQGEVRFIEGKLTGSLATVAPGLYVLIMQPSNEDLIMQSTVTNADGTSSIVSTPYSIPNWGCPYFFRMKGVYQDLTPPPPPVFRETIPEVISIHETMQASDFFHVERTANIVVYNKGGHYDYLRDAQYGIRISWGWNSDPDNPPTRTFTGIVIGVNSGEVAGKETIEIQCQDYMYILRNMPIINSPFYDGMIDHYAIADMAERAGIVTTIPNWYGQIDQYFLNAGYAITQPAVRYTGTQMLYDCMIDVVKRSESYIYFDEDGNFHVTRLPGGLFGEGSHNLVMADFTRDPNGTSVILDEKNVEYSTDSSFNEISVLTMDRNTRNPIIVAKQASGINILQFKKVHLIDQPAFGSKSAAWVQLLRMAEREFYPIRKISFKTAGNIDSLLRVFDFIIVDGDEFRLLSINRNYNAESNDFTADYNAEWLYGLGNGP